MSRLNQSKPNLSRNQTSTNQRLITSATVWRASRIFVSSQRDFVCNSHTKVSAIKTHKSSTPPLTNAFINKSSTLRLSAHQGNSEGTLIFISRAVVLVTFYPLHYHQNKASQSRTQSRTQSHTQRRMQRRMQSHRTIVRRASARRAVRRALSSCQAFLTSA